MRELTIQDIETIIRSDENRILEVKKTTGEIDAGMSSGCAFLNTDGGWLLFGIAPKSLKILGQDVTDPTKQEIANHLRKFDPLINPYVQYVDVPESDGKKVIAIYFDPAEYSDVPYSYDGRPYYKVKNTTTWMPNASAVPFRPASMSGVFPLPQWLFRSGWMESWGRGIANIMEACEQAGLPKPEFIKAPWITRIIFRFKTPLTPYLSGKGGNGSSSEPINEPLNEPLNYSNIQVKTTHDAIKSHPGIGQVKTTHDAIKSHPGIGRSGIMAQTGLSLPSVKRYIAELTAKGYIEHRGSKKTGGYFPINKQ